jgi:hypothetical protein
MVDAGAPAGIQETPLLSQSEPATKTVEPGAGPRLIRNTQ